MLPPSVRIFLCTTPQDMRRSFDGLALATTQVLGQDARSGALYVFINKRANRTKVLWWEKNGFCLLYKRLHRAIFRSPRSGEAGSASIRIDARELATLLSRVVREDSSSRAPRRVEMPGSSESPWMTSPRW